MQYHVSTLDARTHSVFLEQGRRDPVTKQEFKVGDRVVMCAACRSAFLESSWRAFGRTHCGQERTLKNLATDIPRGRFSRTRPAYGTPPPAGTSATATASAGTKATASSAHTAVSAHTAASSHTTIHSRATPPPAAPATPSVPPPATPPSPAPAPGHVPGKGSGASSVPVTMARVPVRLADVPISLQPIITLRKAPL